MNSGCAARLSVHLCKPNTCKARQYMSQSFATPSHNIAYLCVQARRRLFINLSTPILRMQWSAVLLAPGQHWQMPAGVICHHHSITSQALTSLQMFSIVLTDPHTDQGCSFFFPEILINLCRKSRMQVTLQQILLHRSSVKAASRFALASQDFRLWQSPTQLGIVTRGNGSFQRRWECGRRSRKKSSAR